MREPGLAAIRRESVGKIFEVLSDGGLHSRTELAEGSGLSLMTVGKVIGLLESASLVTQKKEDTASAGRKSSLCALDKSKSCVVIGESSVFVVNLCGEVTRGIPFDGDPGMTVMGAVLDLDEPFGVGRIAYENAPFVNFPADITLDPHRAAALGRFENSGVYIRLSGDSTVSGAAVVIGGRLFEGARGLAGRGCDTLLKAVFAAEFLDPDEIAVELPDGVTGAYVPENVTVFTPEEGRRAAAAGMAKLLISRKLDLICDI